jgi:putative NADPH-quinone reductase
MRVLVVFAHPVESSYNAALHHAVVRALTRAGHAVDDLDLYAERFNPVLTRDERLAYHGPGLNLEPVAPYVERLRRAEGVVWVFPVWTFGVPAIMKGFLDRVFLPGVAFHLKDSGVVEPGLGNIVKMAVVTTYGRTWWRARVLVGDPIRKQMTRAVRWYFHPSARCRYLALYDMNTATEAKRNAFLARVERAMATF